MQMRDDLHRPILVDHYLEDAKPIGIDIDPTVASRDAEGSAQTIVGFAAETDDVIANGRAKLERKGVDAVVANDVSSSKLGFDAERNAGIFLKRDGAVEIPAMSKSAMAERILDETLRLRLQSLAANGSKNQR